MYHNPYHHTMLQLNISGLWKDINGAITHYAVHVKQREGATKAFKITKQEAIQLIENCDYIARTIQWDYERSQWEPKEKICISENEQGKFLSTHHPDIQTDGLIHLIDYDWICS